METTLGRTPSVTHPRIGSRVPLLNSSLGPGLRGNLRRVGSSHLHPRHRQGASTHLRIQCAHQELYHTTDNPISTFGYSPDFDQKYELGERIGAGTFGTVHIATDRSTGQRFAVKRMPKRFGGAGMLERYYVRRIRNEVDIGTHLGASLNVAYLYGAYESETAIDLVMELCTGGELWDKIKARGGKYSERDAARMVRELLRTVAQCHASGVLMRDVKPENFLFASDAPDAPLKAIDFGISLFCEPGQVVDLRAGTPIYIAPEVLRNSYSLSADIWSAGIVAYQLLTGRLPFSGEEGAEVAELYMTTQKYDNKEVFRAVLYSELDFTLAPWDTLSSGAKELVQSMLSRDAETRPTADEALAHPWLTDCDDGGATEIPLCDSIVQRLQRYGTFGRLKQAALRKVAAAAVEKSGSPSGGLPAALGAAFSVLDPGATGRVPLAGLRTELQGGHFNLTPAEADQLLAQVDPDEDGSVDWEAWVAAMSDWRSIRESGEWDALVAAAFKSLDRDDDEVLHASDLEVLLCGEEGCAIPGDLDSALREVDSDHDGAVSLEEFKDLLAGHDSDLKLFDPRVVGESEASSSS